MGSSWSSSKVASDGQNPGSEMQHPLLLPTVLDAIFPYLTFAEVKSNRHVCKTWGQVGVPFIGRRNLKPINFSNVSHQDFLSLKQEFQEFQESQEFQDQSKPHPKVKLFQGFRLTWEEVGKMSYCNFMSSFKPNHLIISGGNVSSDSSTNLASILQPILPTLTHLTMNIGSFDYSGSFNRLLINFAQLQPMTLKILSLEITDEDKVHHFTREEMDAIYRSFEAVFQSQNQTLEELKLKFKCIVTKPGNHQSEIDGMEFPVFPSLQHLTLALDIKETTTIQNNYNYLPIFAPFDFCSKFPKLVKLKLSDSTLHTMRNNAIVMTRGHPLMKKLKVFMTDLDLIANANIHIFENLPLSFPNLEELRIEDSDVLNLRLGGIEISWVDTLKVLDGFSSLKAPNLGHMKKLEYLHYTFSSKISFEELPIASIIEMLLEHHRQLPHLKRFHLTYEIEDIIPPEIMSQILEGLPEEFLAILILDCE